MKSILKIVGVILGIYMILDLILRKMDQILLGLFLNLCLNKTIILLALIVMLVLDFFLHHKIFQDLNCLLILFFMEFRFLKFKFFILLHVLLNMLLGNLIGFFLNIIKGLEVYKLHLFQFWQFSRFYLFYLFFIFFIQLLIMLIHLIKSFIKNFMNQYLY